MKRVLAILFILTALLVVSQIQTCIASYKLYLWKLHNEGAQVTAEYQVDITASDSWEADMPFEVDATLISKNYYKVKIDSAKVILNSENFSLESFGKKEPAILTQPADYWQETFAFTIPLDKLVSGETFTVSAVAVIALSSVPGSSEGLNGTWDNYGDPVTVSLHFFSQSTSPTPSPSPQETGSFPTANSMGFIALIIIALLASIVYVLKRKS